MMSKREAEETEAEVVSRIGIASDFGFKYSKALENDNFNLQKHPL